ncbi:MAG TPA: NAD(P)/FAD-dependent oxidoreductase, partial [Acidimicrobiia bacterium]|nr:NAD(P)/FAD-dependent oxidoreductase [Acidimicrobiia bacterium]
MTDQTALVVGGGPGGAVAALLLARAGYAVTVVERVAEPRAVGAGILLQPNGLAVLYGLGLRDALAVGQRVTSATISDPRGRVLLRIPTPTTADGLDHMLVLRRADLASVLYDALAAEPNVEVVFGQAVTDWRDGAVVAGAYEYHADLVIAADGVHSLLRNAIAPGAKVKKGPTYVRAIVPIATQSDAAGEWWTELGLFGAAPVDANSTYVFSSATDPELKEALAATDPAWFARRWHDVLPEAGRLFAGATELLVNDCDEVHAPTWVNGNAVLLGDAAHGMLPNAGQGANSAFVDAAVLVDELRKAGLQFALAAYAARRQPAVALVQQDAALLARLAHLRNPAVRAARLDRGCVRRHRRARHPARHSSFARRTRHRVRQAGS